MNDNLINIFKDCHFSDYFSSEYVEEYVLDYLPFDFEYDYFSGASKACIIPKDKTYVFKIPYKYSYDEEESFPLLFANQNKNHNWDYCYTEMLIYHKAKQKKIENFFCKTKFLGMVDGHPIYIQDRAIPMEQHEYYGSKERRKNEFEKASNKMRAYSKQNSFYFSIFEPLWMSDAVEYYGEEKFLKFMQFISENGICYDLAPRNIGYINDQPVLFDYSDYSD